MTAADSPEEPQAQAPDSPAPQPRRRRRLSPGRKALFALVSTLVLVGVPELAFRVREVVRKRRRPSLPVQEDPYRHIVPIPGARYEDTRRDRRIEINRDGFRGPEIEQPKPAGRRRIYCAGGSTTFGLYTSRNQHTWPAQLEARLREAGHEVDVINAGAPGWTSRTSMTHLELKGFSLEPDVLVVYHAYNDLMTFEEGERYVRESQADDVELLYNPPPPSLVGTLRQASALARFVHSRIRKSRHEESLKEKTTELDPEYVAAFARNLRRLVRRAREQGCRVALCTFPTCFRETLEASREDRVPELHEWYDKLSPLPYERLLEGLGLLNDVVRQVAQETGAILIELERTFPKDVALYESPLHHSDAGEERVAAEVAEALTAAGALSAAE